MGWCSSCDMLFDSLVGSNQSNQKFRSKAFKQPQLSCMSILQSKILAGMLAIFTFGIDNPYFSQCADQRHFLI